MKNNMDELKATIRGQNVEIANLQVSLNKYILLDLLLCSIAEYFYEMCRILTSP